MKDKNLIIILAGAVIIVAIILAVGLNKESQPTNNFQAEVQHIEQQSTSDDPEEIEQDLMDTELDSLDQELQDIDQEIDSAY